MRLGKRCDFWAWFHGSKVVGDDNKPLVLYRGTRNHPQDPYISCLNAPSFVADPRIASIYSHLIVSKSNGWSCEYKPHGSVHPVYLSIKNPVKLHWTFDYETGLNGSDIFVHAMRFGKPDGITAPDVLKVLKALARRHHKDENIHVVVYHDRDADEIDDEGGLYFDSKGQMRQWSPLSRLVQEFQIEVEHGGDTKDMWAILYRLVVDPFAVADLSEFVDVAKKLGFDGVYHTDVTQEHIVEAVGYDPDEFDRCGDEDDICYVTWRPFYPEQQVCSIWNCG